MTTSSSEASTAELVALVTVLVVSCITTVLANAMVLAVVTLREKLHTPTYFYYLSLAASDLILGVLCTPLVIVAFVLHEWPLGDTVCQIYAVLISLSANASIMTLSIISFDRYTALSKPIEHRAGLTFTKRRYKLIIIGGWLHSLFWASGLLFKWGSTKFDPYTHTCKPDWGGEGIANKTYVVGLATFAFVIPVGAMVYAYYKIYRIARASRKESYEVISNSAQKSRSTSEVVANDKEETGILRKISGLKDAVASAAEDNKALKTVLLLIGSFAGCWSLYTVATLWKLFAPNSVPPWMVRAGLVLTLCHCCIDPFIYSIRNEKMRQELKDMVGKMFAKDVELQDLS